MSLSLKRHNLTTAVRCLFEKHSSAKNTKPCANNLQNTTGNVLNDFPPRVYIVKVSVFFFASLKLFVQNFRQSVLLLQSFQFHWEYNQTNLSFFLSWNLLFNSLGSSMGTYIYVRFLTEFCSHQLHFCRVLHCLTAYGFNKCRTSLSSAPKYKINAVKIEERSGIHIE